MKTQLLALCMCVALAAVPALAHGGEIHVIGTVAKVAADSITVKTTADKMVTVSVGAETTFTKANAPAKLADLTLGDRIVIHAKGTPETSLVADTVEFATAPKGATPSPNETKPAQ